MAIQYMFPDGLPGTSAVYHESPSIEAGNVFHLDADLTGWTLVGARLWIEPDLVASLPANVDIFGVYGDDITVHAQTKRRAVVAGWNTVTFDTPLAISPIKLPFTVSYKFVEDPTAYLSFSPSPPGGIVCPTNPHLVMDVPGLAVRSLYRIGTGSSVQNTGGNLYGVDVIVNATNVAPALSLSSDLPQLRTTDTAHLLATATDDVGVASYAWSITSGPSTSPSLLTGASTATPTFASTTLGTYVLSCTVTDTDGATTSASITLTVLVPTPLVVHVPGQATPTRLLPYTLTASTTGGFGTKAFAWSILSSPTGVTGSFDHTNTASVAFTATDVGDFVLRCTVTDVLNTEHADLHVRVLFEPPAPATYFLYDGFIWVPQTVEYL